MYKLKLCHRFGCPDLEFSKTNLESQNEGTTVLIFQKYILKYFQIKRHTVLDLL